MRLYAVALIIWAATITAFSVPNVANLSDEKVVDYTELRDLPEKQIARFYVTTGIEARSSGQTGIEDHPDVDSSGSAIRADEKGSNDVSTSDSSTPETIYATPLAETIDEYPFEERSRESGYPMPEEILLIENAGNFGQRVRQDHSSGKTIVRNTVPKDRVVDDGRKDDRYTNIQKSFSSTASPLEDEDGRAYVSVTSEPYVFALKKKSDSTDPPPFNDSEVIESKASNSEEILNVETAMENSSAPTETDVASSLDENDVVPEDLQARARLSRAYNDTADEIMERPAESVEKKSVVRVSSSTSVEISPSLQPVKFSGPIIVPDLTDRETSEITTDYIDDSDVEVFRSVENAEITPESYAEGSKQATSNSIETSSIMLNPLQAGIALMNADETGSMNDSEQSAATDTKNYLQNYLQDDLQRLSDKKFVESDVENRSRVDYKDDNFQRERVGEKSPAIEAVTQNVPENSVEIQKSVEIYHTAPVHEIHYPPVYIQQTSNLGVIETNNIGRSNQYGQDELSESRSNYDVYRGNEQSTERDIIKVYASEQKLARHQYNALEDNLGKPTTSAVIAEYTSSEQAPIEKSVEVQPYKYNNLRPVLLIPNQFDDTLYDQSNVRHSFKDNGNAPPHVAKIPTYAGITRQESASEMYRSDQRPPQSPSQQTTIDHQNFRTLEARRPEVPQLLLKIIPNGSSADEGFMVPIPRPYSTIEKIIEKTVHVPHPIEIEKVVERKVPFPVERVVEKRVQVPVPVAVPQLYPVHVQVSPMVEKQIRVPHVYPIHVEQLIEKRVPAYTVQRLLVQPAAPTYSSSLHQLRLSTAPTEKPAISARHTSSVPRPYRADTERPVVNGDTSKSNIDIQAKHRQKPTSSANSRGGGGVSAAFEPQSETQNASQLYIPPYGRPLTFDYNIDFGKGYVPFTDVKLMILPRRYSSHVTQRPQAQVASPTYAVAAAPFRQQIVYNLVERNKANKNDEYVGPAPPRKISQSKAKSPPFAASVAQSGSATTAALRRSRQPETQYPGSFRQSKMEYGFKPPMVPSVQYDEMTATQVEN